MEGLWMLLLTDHIQTRYNSTTRGEVGWQQFFWETGRNAILQLWYRVHELGTGFMVNKQERHLVMSFNPISWSISILRIMWKVFNFSIIYAHVPIETSAEDNKEDFMTSWEMHTMTVLWIMIR